MNKPLLKLKAPITQWKVEASHMVEMPDKLEALNLDVLRHQLQQLTLRYRPSRGKPPLGPLTFRYETDEQDRVTIIHAYFTGRDKKLKRFARLRRS